MMVPLFLTTHENSPVTTPSPLLPSTQAVAADSFKTVGSADGSQLPDLMSLEVRNQNSDFSILMRLG